MVQVLPYVPSPLEQLTPHLAQFGANIAEGFEKKRAKTALQQLLGGGEQPAVTGQTENVQQGSSPQRAFNPIEMGQVEQLMEKGYGRDAAQAGIRALENQQKQIAKNQAEIAKEDRAEIREFTKPYSDINTLKTQVNKLEEAKKLIRSGGVSFDENMFRTAISGILEGKENPLAETFKTPEQQKLWYLLRDSLKPKEIGGSNPSTREVLIAQSALPSGLKGRAANEYIINSMINLAKQNLKTGESISSVRKKNPNASFAQFQEDLNAQIVPYQQQLQEGLAKQSAAFSQIEGKKLPKGSVWMVSPDGTVGSVPIGQVEAAKEQKFTPLE